MLGLVRAMLEMVACGVISRFILAIWCVLVYPAHRGGGSVVLSALFMSQECIHFPLFCQGRFFHPDWRAALVCVTVNSAEEGGECVCACCTVLIVSKHLCAGC